MKDKHGNETYHDHWCEKYKSTCSSVPKTNCLFMYGEKVNDADTEKEKKKIYEQHWKLT
jgi:hypothetical protein